MNKAEQATVDEFKEGLYKWLDLFKENFTLQLDNMDRRTEARMDGMDKRMDGLYTKVKDYTTAATVQAAPAKGTPTMGEKIRVFGWAFGKVSMIFGGGAGGALFIREILQYFQ